MLLKVGITFFLLCFLSQIYFNTMGYISTVKIHYLSYFKKSNKYNSIMYGFFNTSIKAEGRSI